MKNYITKMFLLVAVALSAQTKADLLVVNAKIYTVDKQFSTKEAMAVKDGKIIAIGTTSELEKNYVAAQKIDAQQQPIYPGFYDAHAHFYELGLTLQTVDLRGTKSLDEVIERVVRFQKNKKAQFITGHGWDQNDWADKLFPTNEKLNALFPNTAVILSRIDGHALLANQKAISLAKITDRTPETGGKIVRENGKLTGVFIDNPMEFINKIIPKPTQSTQIAALQDAQKVLFDYGITTVNEAGLEIPIIQLIDKIQQQNKLQINVYAMALATPKNIDYYLKKGIYKTNQLNMRSFKLMGDGALGSRGAFLHDAYSDQPNHYGALRMSKEAIKNTVYKVANSPFQLNAHAIGDATNTILLDLYKEALKDKPNRRWKIEHAQIMREQDFELFSLGIIPSVQPTHATSDMYWATDRVGEQRIKNAYAYKKLLDKAGVIALGTDFPIEEVNPMLTFHAAVARQDIHQFPTNGYMIENALSREETLKGMTIWAAYSNFEETEKGSLEVGKWADFVIFNKDIMTIPIHEVINQKPHATFVKGKRVK